MCIGGQSCSVRREGTHNPTSSTLRPHDKAQLIPGHISIHSATYPAACCYGFQIPCLSSRYGTCSTTSHFARSKQTCQQCAQAVNLRLHSIIERVLHMTIDAVLPSQAKTKALGHGSRYKKAQQWPGEAAYLDILVRSLSMLVPPKKKPLSCHSKGENML